MQVSPRWGGTGGVWATSSLSPKSEQHKREKQPQEWDETFPGGPGGAAQGTLVTNQVGRGV